MFWSKFAAPVLLMMDVNDVLATTQQLLVAERALLDAMAAKLPLPHVGPRVVLVRVRRRCAAVPRLRISGGWRYSSMCLPGQAWHRKRIQNLAAAVEQGRSRKVVCLSGFRLGVEGEIRVGFFLRFCCCGRRSPTAILAHARAAPLISWVALPRLLDKRSISPQPPERRPAVGSSRGRPRELWTLSSRACRPAFGLVR